MSLARYYNSMLNVLYVCVLITRCLGKRCCVEISFALFYLFTSMQFAYLFYCELIFIMYHAFRHLLLKEIIYKVSKVNSHNYGTSTSTIY